MKYSASYSYNYGELTIRDLGRLTEVTGSVSAPLVPIRKGASGLIKAHVTDYLTARGWVSSIRVDPTRRPTINEFHPDGILLQIQVGNAARAFYDLMKMQSMYEHDMCKAGVLIAPSAEASRKLGGNLANIDRITDELEWLYQEQIRIPLLLLSFE